MPDVRETVQTLVEKIVCGEVNVEQTASGQILIGQTVSKWEQNRQVASEKIQNEKAINWQGNIDRNRVYIYGYSAGGVGTLGFLKDSPNFYAGAVSICGATGKNGMENLPHTPLWLVHAADDQIVKASYKDNSTRELAHFGSRDLYEEMRHIPNWDFRYTEYPAGWMQEHYHVNPHCSWVAVSGEHGTEIREWLFAQKLHR